MSNIAKSHAQNVLFPDEEWNLVQQAFAKLNTEQRLWLSGYLAGYEQEAGQSKILNNDSADSKGLLIAYGGETGNSMELANKFSKLTANEGLRPNVSDLTKVKLRHLQREKVTVIICSTHGDGDPPETIKMFHKELQEATSGSLKELSYAVLALGDSSYERFCQTGKDIDEYLEKAGAKRMLPRVECDVDFEEDAERWSKEILPRLKALIPENGQDRTSFINAENISTESISKSAPGKAEVLENICLSHPSRKTGYRHVELALDTPLYLKPGDAIGIFPKNSATLVAFVLAATGLDGDEIVSLKNQEASLSKTLTDSVDLVIANKKTLTQWANWSKNSDLENIIDGATKDLRNYLKTIQIIDLLEQFPIRPKAQEFVDCLRPLQPRLYDVINYQVSQQDEIHLLVKNYQYWFNSRIETGVTSEYFSALSPGEEIAFYPHTNHKFHLPENQQNPLILISTGSGIGPYRAFLDFYRSQTSRPPIWIIFQENQFEQDFLYQLEWQEALKDGLINHFDGVFVNDTPGASISKIIVNNLDRLNQWISQGAHIYLCGDKEILNDTESKIKAFFTTHSVAKGNENIWEQLTQQGHIHKNLY